MAQVVARLPAGYKVVFERIELFPRVGNVELRRPDESVRINGHPAFSVDGRWFGIVERHVPKMIGE